jgi:hypothetical protein
LTAYAVANKATGRYRNIIVAPWRVLDAGLLCKNFVKILWWIHGDGEDWGTIHFDTNRNAVKIQNQGHDRLQNQY